MPASRRGASGRGRSPRSLGAICSLNRLALDDDREGLPVRIHGEVGVDGDGLVADVAVVEAEVA